MLWLLDGAVVGFETEVEADAAVVGLADEPQPAERFEHLDPVGTHLLLHLVVGSHTRRAHTPLPVPAPHARVRIDHTQVGIHAEPGDQEALGRVVLALVDAPVIDVAIARGDVAHRHRDLVDRVLVERIHHGSCLLGVEWPGLRFP